MARLLAVNAGSSLHAPVHRMATGLSTALAASAVCRTSLATDNVNIGTTTSMLSSPAIASMQRLNMVGLPIAALVTSVGLAVVPCLGNTSPSAACVVAL